MLSSDDADPCLFENKKKKENLLPVHVPNTRPFSKKKKRRPYEAKTQINAFDVKMRKCSIRNRPR